MSILLWIVFPRKCLGTLIMSLHVLQIWKFTLLYVGHLPLNIYICSSLLAIFPFFYMNLDSFLVPCASKSTHYMAVSYFLHLHPSCPWFPDSNICNIWAWLVCCWMWCSFIFCCCQGLRGSGLSASDPRLKESIDMIRKKFKIHPKKTLEDLDMNLDSHIFKEWVAKHDMN